MAEEDVTGGMAAEGDAGDGEGAEWVAPESVGLDEEAADRELASKLVDEMGIEPRSEEEKAQTIAAMKKAGFQTAADLLPPDPLEALPVSDEEAPPDEAVPTFIIVPNAYGPGVASVKFSDGTPVGVWLDRERHDADPAAVAQELLALGLPEEHALKFADRRASRDEANDNILRDPSIAGVVAAETARRKVNAEVQKAFVEAYKKKEKK